MRCLRCRKPVKQEKFYGLHKDCFFKCFKLPDILEFSNLDPKKQDISGLPYPLKKTKDSFYRGRYRKYSAQLDSARYILKVKEDKYPDLPAMEYVCNNIASFLGLSVPEYCLVRYQGKITFVTRDFMQDYKGGTLHHIYKFLPKGAKNYNCKNIINVLFQQTRPADVARFIQMVLFDSLIGNDDRHGGNFGIIESAKGRRLAPMYDNPSYFGVEDLLGADLNPSGDIWTSSSKEPKLLDYIKEFHKLGFRRICLEFLEDIIRQSQEITEEVKSSEISQARKKAFMKFLEKQFQILKDYYNA